MKTPGFELNYRLFDLSSRRFSYINKNKLNNYKMGKNPFGNLCRNQEMQFLQDSAPPPVTYMSHLLFSYFNIKPANF